MTFNTRILAASHRSSCIGVKSDANSLIYFIRFVNTCVNLLSLVGKNIYRCHLLFGQSVYVCAGGSETTFQSVSVSHAFSLSLALCVCVCVY